MARTWGSRTSRSTRRGSWPARSRPTMPTSASSTGAWTAAPVLGLRLDPNNTTASIGQQMLLHWARLVPADASALSPTAVIQWTGAGGSYDLDVRELGPNPAAPLSIATGVTGTSFSWKYGLLPPGAYRLTVTRVGSGQSAT